MGMAMVTTGCRAACRATAAAMEAEWGEGMVVAIRAMEAVWARAMAMEPVPTAPEVVLAAVVGASGGRARLAGLEAGA